MSGFLRIRKQSDRGAGEGGARDEYYSRLLKLVPGEIAALYAFALALFKGSPRSLYVALAVCAVVLIVLRSSATKARSGSVQWAAVVISLLSFGIWVVVLGDPIAPLLSVTSQEAAFAMAAWTVLVPAIYKGDPE